MCAERDSKRDEQPALQSLIERSAETRAVVLGNRCQCGQDREEEDADATNERGNPRVAQPAQQHGEERRTV